MIKGDFKRLLQVVLGNRFEFLVSRPHFALRMVRRRSVRFFHGFRALVLPLQKWLQVLHQNIGLAESPKPLSRLLCSSIELLMYWSDRRYRRSFRRFGAALDTIKRDDSSRGGLLLVSGTLGAGGAERQAVITFLGLARRGLERLNFAVVYLFTEHQRFYLSRLEAAGMPPLPFNRNESKDGEGELAQILTAAKLLPAEIQDVRDYIRTMLPLCPETVHLWLDEVNLKGGLAAVAVGTRRIVLSVRNLPPFNFLFHHPYMREAYRWLLRRPGVILVSNSAAGARAYEHWLGLPALCIRVIHNGFDFNGRKLMEARNRRTDYRGRHNIPLHAPIVGTVIRFNKEKRPLLWMEIAAQVARMLPEAHFLVVGDGPLRAQLEARVARSDLAGRVHLVGLEKHPMEAIAAMDLFLLTSFAEGLPNVLVEAQALGVPVVTTRAGGAPEAMIHGKTGWILESANPRAAATIVMRLLGDKNWLERAGVEARAFVKDSFRVDRLLDETIEVCGLGGRTGDQLTAGAESFNLPQTIE